VRQKDLGCDGGALMSMGLFSEAITFALGLSASFADFAPLYRSLEFKRTEM
jgi:hypothetical protein